MLKRKLIEILADGRFHSGSDVGALLGVSRAAVWKQVKRLEQVGLIVHAVPGKGYQIPGGLDLLDKDKIIKYLDPQIMATLQGFNIIDAADSLLESLSEQLSHQGNPGFYFCLAESKILGREKYGRASSTMYAASASLAMGARVRADEPVWQGLRQAAAVAVRDILGINACLIKWPGEFVVSGKSLGDVRVEVRSAQSGFVDVFIEVDVRIKSALFLSSDKSQSSAISLEGVLRMPVDRNKVIGEMLSALATLIVASQSTGVHKYLSRWQTYDLLVDRKISLKVQGREVEGCARGLDPSGFLRVETSKGLESFETGEVELK